MRAVLWACLAIAASSCTPATDGQEDCASDIEGVQSEVSLWPDADGDGFTAAASEVVCAGAEVPDGYLAEATETDCDDASGGTYPGATDIEGDGVDQDCDGEDAVAEVNTDVFVDGADPDCQDVAPGTKAAPNCTLEAATSHVQAGGAVRIALGDYTISPLFVAGGYDFIGGYDPATWTRSPGDRTILRDLDEGGGMLLGTHGGTTGDHPTVIEGLHLIGSQLRFSSLTVAVQFGSIGGVLRDVRAEAGPGHDGGGSGALMVASGRWRVEDCELFGSPNHTGSSCYGVFSLGDADLAIERTSIGGCDKALKSVGVDAVGRVEMVDSTVSMRAAGDATGLLARAPASEARVFLTGVVVEVDGGSAVGLEVTGARSRVEMKSSAFFGAGPTTGDSRAARVVDGGTLRAANSLFFPSASVEGDAIGVDVDEGDAAVVNSMIRGASAPGVSAAVRVGEGGHASLVSNNYFGPDQDALLVGEATILDIDSLDGCGWTGCDEARLSRAIDPGFEDLASSFRLVETSPLVDAGIDPSPYGLVVDRDIEGNPAPADGDGDSVPNWDVGPAER